LQDALLYYTTLPGITPAVATAIRNSKQSSMQGGEFLPAYTNRTDAYCAALKNADYTWNSNQTKSSMGQIFWQQIRYNLDPASAASYRAATAGYLHYFHGVNPLSRAYLSNMYAFGAEHCVNEFYHSWFGDGTEWDNALTSPKGPPPGYIPGGANPVWGGPDPSYTGPPIVPPAGQPIQKSYKDWNTSWPENSWEITEAGIIRRRRICISWRGSSVRWPMRIGPRATDWRGTRRFREPIPTGTGWRIYWNTPLIFPRRHRMPVLCPVRNGSPIRWAARTGVT
jgi:endoglucanase